jgi:hypothetical protein
MNSSKKIHWLFSISAALIIYGLFFLLFTPLKQDVQKREIRKNKITLLDVTGKLSHNDRGILEWLKNDDPTLIILPNRKYNYSRVLANNFEFKIGEKYDDSSFLNEVDGNVFKNIEINKLSLPDISKAELTAKYELYSHICLPKIPFTLPNVNILYPCVRNYYTGEIIPIKFPISLKINELIKKYNPQHYTLLNIKSSDKVGLFPSVSVIKSCGNVELDKLAVSNMITQSSAGINYFDFGKNVKVVVEWKK